MKPRFLNNTFFILIILLTVCLTVCVNKVEFPDYDGDGNEGSFILVQLSRNFSFKYELPASGLVPEWGGTDVNRVVQTPARLGGGRSYKIVNGDIIWTGCFYHMFQMADNNPLPASSQYIGNMYVIKAWVYLDTAVDISSIGPFLSLKYEDSPAASVSGFIPDNTPVKKWIQIETPIYTVAPGHSQFTIVINGGSIPGTVVYFTDIEIYQWDGQPPPDAQRPRLSWMDGDNTDTTMTIRWDTSLGSTKNSFVNYGTTEELGTKANATNFRSVNGPNNLIFTDRGHDRQIHTVHLTGLTPNTVYYYKIADDPKLYTFKTAPRKGSTNKFTVGLITDSQNDAANGIFGITGQLVGKMAGHKPDFVIHSGDVVTGYGRFGLEYVTFLTQTSKLFSLSSLMPVSGNHDVFVIEPYLGGTPDITGTKGTGRVNDGWKHAFALPNNTEWYSYTYGNMRVINVYTGLAFWPDYAPNPFNLVDEDGVKQTDWIRNELAAAQADPDITWIVINSHMPVAGDGREGVVINELLPIIKDYPVDLYVTGHAHIYQRLRPLNRSNLTAAVGAPMPQLNNIDHYDLSGGQRMVHIKYATAGANPRGIGDDGHGEPVAENAFYKGFTYTYSIMEVDNRTITWTGYDIDGKAFDKFTISK